MASVIRKSVPVDIHMAALADAVRIEGSLERHALEGMVGPLPQNLSESAALTALLQLAKEVIQDSLLEAQYASLAASRDDEDVAFEAAVRTRRQLRQKTDRD